MSVMGFLSAMLQATQAKKAINYHLFLGNLFVSNCALLTLVGERKLNKTVAYHLTNSLRVALAN